MMINTSTYATQGHILRPKEFIVINNDNGQKLLKITNNHHMNKQINSIELNSDNLLTVRYLHTNGNICMYQEFLPPNSHNFEFNDKGDLVWEWDFLLKLPKQKDGEVCNKCSGIVGSSRGIDACYCN